jgi:hypothetical protein
MIDMEFALFMNRLKQAITNGERIEKSERKRWADYIEEHGILEVASMVHGRAISQNIVPVIIDSDDEWDGFYVYAKDEEVCLKFDRGQ